jgi:hypothetical protein
MDFDFSKYAEKFGLTPDKLNPILEKFKRAPKAQLEAAPDSDAGVAEKNTKYKKNPLDSISSLTKVLTGSASMLGEYYFPPELVGGTCPRVAGEEEDIVWNAAAEVCDTERVHVVWQSVQNKIWYLAVRSSELGSHPNTWCPFSSLLPGMRDATVLPVCYTYYGDESATMMMVTEESMQIFRGTSLVVRAKAERMARELGNAPVIELIPDKILQLTPTPWYSISLFEDRARRVLAAISVFSAISLAALAFVIWLLASMALITAKHNLTETLNRTQNKTMELMGTIEKLRASPMRDQLAKFADLNDGLLSLNALLEVYEIRDGKVRWRATAPANVTADRINELGGKTIETTPDGVVIGNSGEIDYEAVNPMRNK